MNAQEAYDILIQAIKADKERHFKSRKPISKKQFHQLLKL